MTDQIYYKVQYPLKKAINIIKRIDPDDPFNGKEITGEELAEIDSFLRLWNSEGKQNLQDVISKLKKIQ
ncbi:MAG: hypothetical protein FH762_15255 [Firmicutes bacterium]|nr:hypothetical protein [Bacillota bacterium]